jgi:LysR family hydrogen peroxide-inducible transcriptional activator
MDLKRLRYLVAIADAGSFSAAARRAFVSQPTLSVAIAGLETELKTKLFERRGRGVALTKAGERALGHARTVLREVEAIGAAGGQRSAGERPLRLGLLSTLPPELIAAELRRHYGGSPRDAIICAEYAPLDQLRGRLAAGRYDAILTSLQRPQRAEDQREIATDQQVLAYGRRWKPKGRITPRVLNGRPLIVRTHCEFLQAASRILDGLKVRPRIVARADSDAHALAMVAAGLGACLLPDSFKHDGVVFARPEGVNLRRHIGWQWIKGSRGAVLGM